MKEVSSVAMVEKDGCMQLVIERVRKSKIVLRSPGGIEEWFERIKVKLICSISGLLKFIFKSGTICG